MDAIHGDQKKTMGKRGFEAVKGTDFPRHFQTNRCLLSLPSIKDGNGTSPIDFIFDSVKFYYQRVKHSPLVFRPRPELPHSTTKAAPDTENSCCADKATYLYLTLFNILCIYSVNIYRYSMFKIFQDMFKIHGESQIPAKKSNF